VAAVAAIAGARRPARRRRARPASIRAHRAAAEAVGRAWTRRPLLRSRGAILVGASATAVRRRHARRLLPGVRQRRAAGRRAAGRHLVGQLGSLIPVPGGLGGVDGGLIGTLVLYGVDATDAAVAVIAYRGLLLAIPAILGLPLAVLPAAARGGAQHRGLAPAGRRGARAQDGAGTRPPVRATESSSTA
jgi:hypothetical protein